MRRRDWGRLSTAMAVGAACGWLPVGRSAWAATPVEVPPASAARTPRLVVVFLRGAVDGLSVVVPYADPAYQLARPSIGLARPGAEGGVLDLDGYFGLHPALAPLLPLWQAKRLGFVHASGSPDATRSHFDAQDYMESATPGRKATPDGWLNRLLGALPSAAAGEHRLAAPRGISIGPVLPRIYAGTHPVATMASGAASTRPIPLDRPHIDSAFGRLYESDDRLAEAYRQGRESRRDMLSSLTGNAGDGLPHEMQAADYGAPLPGGFPDDAARLATLMRRDARLRLAFMAVGGWDTHANQGAATGQLANRLAPLGRGLAALAHGLGAALDDTVVVVLSEFGRTVRQNGNGGTDHGHGNAMWLMGGPVAGGRVHGRWPGLDGGALYEGRDLAVTTDFRAVLTELAERHLRLSDARLADVFPAFDGRGERSGVLRA